MEEEQLIGAILNLLEMRAHEASFEYACGVISHAEYRPCCACRLRLALGEERLGKTAKVWLATTPSERELIRRRVISGPQQGRFR